MVTSAYETDGFLISRFWTDAECEVLKEHTFSSIYSLLSEWVPSSRDKYPLEQYHLWSKDLGIPHEQVFTTTRRHGALEGKVRDVLLNPAVVHTLADLGLKSFRCTAGPVEKPEDRPLGFRIVRPHLEDAVHLHAEGWYGAGTESMINLWLPILGFDRDSTLCLVPGSHVRDYATVQPSGKFMARRLAETVEEADVLRPALAPGTGILFGSKLLHGAARNLSYSTRISLEVRFIP